MTEPLKAKDLHPVVADAAGFCYGVQRAYDMAMGVANAGGPRYTLGPLIHNKSVVDRLADKGLVALTGPENLADLTKGTVVIRSHGVAKSVIGKAMEQGLDVVDATCPYVRRVHQAAEELLDQGYELIIVGDMGHPEVVGILGTVDGRGRIVGSAKDIAFVDTVRYGVIAQTTQDISTLSEVVSRLLEGAREVRVINTICTATKQRQEGVKSMAPNVDVVIVVGDPHSANTQRLAEISKASGVPTYSVENAADLRDEWFKDGDRVGIAAGASTPSDIIKEVLERMQDSHDDDRQDMLDISDAELFERSFRELHLDDVVKATVVRVAQDEVMVDVGYKSEGIIPLEELSNKSIVNASDVVSVGDIVTAKVIRLNDNEGNIVLSVRQALQEVTWQALKDAFEAGSRVKGTITAVVKGGTTVDLGVRAFLPISQLDRNLSTDLESIVGREFEFYITELDEAKKNVVVSRRKVIEEDAAVARADAYGRLQAGDEVDGQVKRLMAFGAFVDIGGGVEGLLHISEMSWSRIKHPSEVVSEGDTIRVRILEIDKDRQRISLGMKQSKGDPWQGVAEKYPVGTLTKATIGNLATFGAFAHLEDGIDGLIHISQLSHTRVKNPAEVVRPGQVVDVKVVSVDFDTKRIGLSIKDALPSPEAEVSEEDIQAYSSDNGPSGATIGEMLKRALEKGAK